MRVRVSCLPECQKRILGILDLHYWLKELLRQLGFRHLHGLQLHRLGPLGRLVNCEAADLCLFLGEAEGDEAGDEAVILLPAQIYGAGNEIVHGGILINNIAVLPKMNIKKTEEFTYFQLKAKHYENMRKAKPVVHNWRTSQTSSPQRKKPHMMEYEELRANEALVSTIISIKHSPRSRVEVQNGHTRYNNFEGMQKSHYKSFRNSEKTKSIDV